MTIVPATILLLLEFGMSLAGQSYPTTFLVPQPEDRNNLVDNYQFGWRFFPRKLARSSQPLLLSRKKPAGTHRVIVFGGSAAMGDPEPAFGLARTIQANLEHRFPNEAFEVINAAVTAINSHVVLSIAKDCRSLDADALVVYMGNNEVVGPFGAGTAFGNGKTSLWQIRSSLALQRTTIGQNLAKLLTRQEGQVPESWGGMEMFTDRLIRHDSPELARVISNFRANVQDLVRLAHRDQVAVILCTMATNQRSFPPFASLHRLDLTAEQLSRWNEWFEQGTSAQDAFQYNQAIDLYRQAAELDGEFALLHFRLAECLLQQGDIDSAQHHFQLAEDMDALRFRATSQINQIIRDVASEQPQNTTLVHSENVLLEGSGLSSLGQEHFLEHVHLTFRGNFELGQAIAKTIAEKLLLRDEVHAWPTQIECAVRLGFTPFHQHQIATEMQKRLQQPPFTEQPDHDRHMAAWDQMTQSLAAKLTPALAHDMIAQYDQVLAVHTDDWILQEQYAALLESIDRIPDAMEQLRHVTQQMPHHWKAHFKLGSLCNQHQQWADAEPSLRTSLRLRPDFARAYSSLGICLSHQDRIDEAFQHFATAIAVQPDFAEAYFNWGLVCANQEDHPQAVQRFQQATSVDPDYLPAYVELGSYFVSQEDHAAAEHPYSEVVRLKPNDAAARVNLALILIKLQKKQQAIVQLQAALQLEPRNVIARQALQMARSLPD
ncbi:MAG: tetratricopeptide repeat protein [Planctomycetales bacterium]|nr:tetratricopeptide repeat protein [Planctomycetales bacterium]